MCLLHQTSNQPPAYRQASCLVSPLSVAPVKNFFLFIYFIALQYYIEDKVIIVANAVIRGKSIYIEKLKFFSERESGKHRFGRLTCSSAIIFLSQEPKSYVTRVVVSFQRTRTSSSCLGFRSRNTATPGWSHLC